MDRGDHARPGLDHHPRRSTGRRDRQQGRGAGSRGPRRDPLHRPLRRANADPPDRAPGGGRRLMSAWSTKQKVLFGAGVYLAVTIALLMIFGRKRKKKTKETTHTR